MIRRAAQAVVLAFLLGSCASQSTHLVGSKALDFALPRLDNPAEEVVLSEFNRDNPVLLVFWATWCPSCRKEIPELNNWSRAGVRILGVNLEEPREKVLDFVKKTPLDYTVVLDEAGEVAEKYGVEDIPTVILLEKGGEIIYYGFRVPKDLDGLIAQRRN